MAHIAAPAPRCLFAEVLDPRRTKLGRASIPHSTIAVLTTLGLSVATANAALGAALEAIAHDNMLISRLRHSSPTRWRGA